jgi:hypothetical protein
MIKVGRLFGLLKEHNLNVQFDIQVQSRTNRTLVLCSFRRGGETTLELAISNGMVSFPNDSCDRLSLGLIELS